MNEEDMAALAGWIVSALRAPGDETVLTRAANESKELCKQYLVLGID
jgi:glycine/serine hydroxymethyltransferase